MYTWVTTVSMSILFWGEWNPSKKKGPISVRPHILEDLTHEMMQRSTPQRKTGGSLGSREICIYLVVYSSEKKTPSPFSGRDNSSSFFGAWG